MMPWIVRLIRISQSVRLAQLGRILRAGLIIWLVVVGAGRMRADLYQTVIVNVMSPKVFRILRKEYPISEMTEVVKGEAQGPNRIYIKLYVPLGMKKDMIEDIKERCRKAGASSFIIQYKS